VYTVRVDTTSRHGQGERLTADSDIRIPFPTSHLAHTALRAISADKELSSLVSRSFDLEADSPIRQSPTQLEAAEDDTTVLVVLYTAATNRMLRVAVNGFFESLRVVLHVMEELDLDVIDKPTSQNLDGVQGLEDV
jgi:EKC/KEOPS complex subunit PCC1/LAGE3